MHVQVSTASSADFNLVYIRCSVWAAQV